jgi:hypothetical protein
MKGSKQNKRPLPFITYLLLSMLFLFPLTTTQPTFATPTHTLTVSASPTAPTDAGNTAPPTSASQQTNQSLLLPGTLGLLVLSIVLLELVFWSLPAIRRRRALKTKSDDAERRAELVTQHIKVMEAARRNRGEHNRVSDPLQRQGLQDKTVVCKTVSGLRCPNCGEPVDHNAKYCPHCYLAFTSSESGLHPCVQPSTLSVQLSTALTTRVEFDVADIRADINSRQLKDQ